MKKSRKQKITLREAIDKIPHCEHYCNDNGKCPFYCMRKLSKSKYRRLTKKPEDPRFFNILTQFPEPWLEWCTFLHLPLHVQDGIKDCEINCDYTEEQYNQGLEYIETVFKEEHPDLYDDAKRDMLDQKELICRKRITCIEVAQNYKQKFPEEAALIDRIIKEDKLQYWYGGKKEGNKDE